MIEISSVLPWNLRLYSEIFGNLRKMFGECLETFVWPLEQFWKIFGNLWKVVENLRKIVKNIIINILILRARLWIRIILFLSSLVQFDVSPIHCAHS